MKKFTRYAPVLAVLALFGYLVVQSAPAQEGARAGLSLCLATLIPALLPFFVLSNLLADMGLTDLLGQTAGGLLRRTLGLSPAGAQAFLLGLSGGYPLGASVVAELRRQGRVSKAEGERLLAFCNNSGPAYVIGGAGAVFQSPRAGLILYATHVLAAMTLCLVMGRGQAAPAEGGEMPGPAPLSLARAFPGAVARAVSAVMTVCGYVVLFSALLALAPMPEGLPQVWTALAAGFWELTRGIGSLSGLAPTPGNMAAAAFLLGWGGVSVHLQTMGVLAGTDIKCARHLLGRALCGLFAAGIAFVLTAALSQ